jgi:hypothetical protein
MKTSFDAESQRRAGEQQQRPLGLVLGFIRMAQAF